MFCSQLKRKHVALQRRSNLSSAEEQWHGHCAPCSGSEWTRRGEGPQRLPELPLAIWCHVVCIYECALVRYVYIILYIYWYWNIHLSNIYMYNYIIIYIYPEDASHRFMNLYIYIHRIAFCHWKFFHAPGRFVATSCPPAPTSVPWALSSALPRRQRSAPAMPRCQSF